MRVRRKTYAGSITSGNEQRQSNLSGIHVNKKNDNIRKLYFSDAHEC